MTWPKIGLRTRNFFTGFEAAEKVYRLAYRIKAEAPQQGRLRYPVGRELEVLEDDLGIFSEVQRLYWAGSRGSAGLALWEVLVFAPGGGGALYLADPPDEEGNAPRLLCFENALHEVTPMGKGYSLKGRVEKDGRRLFIRSVEGKKDGSDELSQPWEEHSWYAPGRGLERLEQRIPDQVSMTWILKKHIQ